MRVNLQRVLFLKVGGVNDFGQLLGVQHMNHQPNGFRFVAVEAVLAHTAPELS